MSIPNTHQAHATVSFQEAVEAAARRFDDLAAKIRAEGAAALREVQFDHEAHVADDQVKALAPYAAKIAHQVTWSVANSNLDDVVRRAAEHDAAVTRAVIKTWEEVPT